MCNSDTSTNKQLNIVVLAKFADFTRMRALAKHEVFTLPHIFHMESELFCIDLLEANLVWIPM
jgi:hypothetical protein